VTLIKEHSPIVSTIDNRNVIKNCLSCERVFYKQKQFRKQKETYRKQLVDRSGNFYTGFLPRVEKYLQQRKIPFDIEREEYKVTTDHPSLDGIVFRDDQLRALEKMRDASRGVWIAPTGSGKTIIMAGVISMFPASRVLVVVHTKDLLNQTHEELERFFGTVGRIGGGYNDEREITVAMIQTLNNRQKGGAFISEFGSKWELLILDEAHHHITN